MTSPIFNPATRRRHHRRQLFVTTTNPPAALELVSAVYLTGDSVTLTLTFDRPIDLADVEPGAITVDDGDLGIRWFADEYVATSPTTVELSLAYLTEQPPGGISMTATDANGIVAADDGSAWAGVSELALPFPA